MDSGRRKSQKGLLSILFQKKQRKDYCRDEFDIETLDVRYTSLRQPYDSYTSLTERPGYLRLYGQESLNSCYNVSLVARRQMERHVQVETCVEFTPTCREQMAGLAYMYDTGNFYLLVKTRDEEFGNQNLDLKRPAKTSSDKKRSLRCHGCEFPEIDIPEDEPLFLRVVTTRRGYMRNSFTHWMEKSIKN